MEKQITDLLNAINEPLGGLMVAILSITGIWFTFRTRGVQFRMFGEMFRLLFNSGDDTEVNGKKTKRVSSFEAFTVSRCCYGNSNRWPRRYFLDVGNGTYR